MLVVVSQEIERVDSSLLPPGETTLKTCDINDSCHVRPSIYLGKIWMVHRL